MKNNKVRLVDFGPNFRWGDQLKDILLASHEPRMEVVHQRCDGVHPTCLARNFAPPVTSGALTILVFDSPVDAELMNGLLKALCARINGRPLIVVTPAQSPAQMTELLHLGAADIWLPPLRAIEALGRVSYWLDLIPSEEKESIEQLKKRLSLSQFIGESPVLISELKKIPILARHDVTVLIRGETGSGKELCARAIHSLSDREDYPFVAVNCGALPVDLIENELFGHCSGAYTSANSSAGGLVEQAEGGTLFLDEIDSLPTTAQVKLLRFLQDKEFRPLGAQRPRCANLRVIAATNRKLEEAMLAGTFRQDLYYRLSVTELNLPRLRDRAEDVISLAAHFLGKYAAEFGKAAGELTGAAKRKLLLHSWPGNVRELENVIARAVLLSPNPLIGPECLDIPTSGHSAATGGAFNVLKAQAIEAFETSYLTKVLGANGGNISRAARAAGKNRRAFWELLRKHGLNASEESR